MQPQRARTATPSAPPAPARLVAARGRFPWLGHFQVATGDARAMVWLCGRVRSSADPAESWKRVQDVVGRCAALAAGDRETLSQRVWAAIGDDLKCALLVARDERGTHVESLNLAGVVDAGHPPRALATAEVLATEGPVRVAVDGQGPWVGWTSRDRMPAMDTASLASVTGHLT